MELEDMAREAAKELNFRDPAIISPPDRTSIYIQFLNDRGKYEQIEIMPEPILERDGYITTKGFKEEINQMLKAGKSKLLN